MDLKTALQQYAKVLLVKGINLQKKQILVINAPVESHEFVEILTEAAYEHGASQVVVNWRSDGTARLRYQYEKLEQFTKLPDWRRDFSLYYYHQGAAVLSLVAANPYLMNGIDTKKLFAWQKAQHQALQEYIDGMMASKISWLVAAVPGKVWAKLLFPELPEQEAHEALWKKILSASRADGADPLQAWDEHLQNLAQRRDWLTAQQFTSLHYESANGTDLAIALPAGHVWQGGSEETAAHIPFNANIPTEEVYTAPLRTGVNGVVYSTKPLVYNGNVIDGFRLEFQAGKVIALQARQGEAILQELLQADEGAPYLGEVALVPYHSPISLSQTLYYETLFDENASCHLAFGKAYPTCLKKGAQMSNEEVQAAGLNESLIHVDFMVGTEDLSITGINQDGTEVPVFVKGDFIKF